MIFIKGKQYYLQKKKEKNLPKENGADVLEKLGLHKYVNKFIEQKVIEPELFYSLTDDDLANVLEIKIIGDRHTIMKVINEVEERGKKEEEDEELEHPVNLLKFAKSMTLEYQ